MAETLPLLCNDDHDGFIFSLLLTLTMPSVTFFVSTRIVRRACVPNLCQNSSTGGGSINMEASYSGSTREYSAGRSDLCVQRLSCLRAELVRPGLDHSR